MTVMCDLRHIEKAKHALIFLGVMLFVLSFGAIAQAASFSQPSGPVSLSLHFVKTKSDPIFAQRPCSQQKLALDEHKSHCPAKLLTLTNNSQTMTATPTAKVPSRESQSLAASFVNPDPPPPRTEHKARQSAQL